MQHDPIPHTRGNHADDFSDTEPCYCDPPKTIDSEDWENEFWEIEKRFNLSLDNENYEDLMTFARFYEQKGRTSALLEALGTLPQIPNAFADVQIGMLRYKHDAILAITTLLGKEQV